MKIRKLSLLFLTFFTFINFSQSSNIDEIKKSADLFLDMMEYDLAIQYYIKFLEAEPKVINIRKNIAYAYFRTGWIDKAIKYLKEELTLFPENGDAYDLLVFILYKNNKIEESLEYLEKFSQIGKGNVLNENSGLGDFLLGIFFKNKGLLEKAKEYILKSYDRGYDSIQCFFQLIDLGMSPVGFNTYEGTIRLREGSLSGTVTEMRVGYRPEIYFGLGVYFLKLSERNINFFLNALSYFEKAISMNPSFEEALFNLGATYYNYKEFDKACSFLEKLSEKSSENKYYKFLYNCALYKSGKDVKEENFQFQECPKRIEFKKTIPPNIEYKHQLINEKVYVLSNINFLAMAHIREGNINKAIQKLNNGIKIWDECPEINYNLGMLYLNLNNLRDAEKHALIATKFPRFSKVTKRKEAKKEEEKIDVPVESLPIESWTFDLALERGNNFLEAYDLLGNIYFKKGEFEKSVQSFKKVLELDPSDAIGYYNLGCAYFAMKDYEKAEKSWNEAIKNDRRKKEKGEEAMEESGQMPRVSVTVLKRTISFHSYKSLGSLYQEKGDVRRAIESYQKAIEIFPMDADCYYELGKLYIQIGEKKNAIKYLEKYLEYGTEKEGEVKELLKRLREESARKKKDKTYYRHD